MGSDPHYEKEPAMQRSGGRVLSAEAGAKAPRQDDPGRYLKGCGGREDM